jgi:DNA-binding LytR/AlgR family response regulator
MSRKMNVKESECGTFVQMEDAETHMLLYIGLQMDDVVDFLSKLAAERQVPLQKVSFNESKSQLVERENKNFYLWDSGKLILVESDRIVYLEACRCYCEIHMADGKLHVPSLSLSKVAEYLSRDHFIRVHRTFVVNRKMLKEICGNMIFLPDGKQLPIGREYRKRLMQSLNIINTRNKKYFP